MKILIFADLKYCHSVIVENTQAQYFDNLIFFKVIVRECLQQ